MPYLGDGTFVADKNLAQAIIQGKTNYIPWSHDITNLQVKKDKPTPQRKKKGYASQVT
jgi:hypothetical protein